MSSPVAYPQSPSRVDGFSAASQLEEDLQEKRIKEIVLPILAVLAGFLLFPLDIAILFTAVVIFGVFICGNGPASNPPSPPLDQDDPEERIKIRISPSPEGLRGGRVTPATPKSGRLFEFTPRTVKRVELVTGLELDYIFGKSPQTLCKEVTQRGLAYDPNKALQTAAYALEEKTHRPEQLGTPRDLKGDFDLPSIPED